MRIVLVGGLGGTADLDFLAPMLGREHDVTAVDARDALSTDADTAVIGYSVGAVAALQHAALHPVASLVVLSAWLEPSARLVDWSTAAPDPAHTLLGPRGWGRDVHVDPELAALAATARAEVGGIRAPALVVGGTHDTLADSRLVFGALADARYTELPTGHAMLAERPAAVHALIDAFLRAPRRVPAGAEFTGAGA